VFAQVYLITGMKLLSRMTWKWFNKTFARKVKIKSQVKALIHTFAMDHTRNPEMNMQINNLLIEIDKL
jgi:hypothetical protein